MTNTQKNIANKVNSVSEDEAIEVYIGLRVAVADERKKKSEIAASLMKVMVMAGNALEARIGECRFDEVMENADTQIYA